MAIFSSDDSAESKMTNCLGTAVVIAVIAVVVGIVIIIQKVL